MKKMHMGKAVLVLSVSLMLSFPSYAAAPTISIGGISEGSSPYTFTFAVSDDSGITSITVNGQELGPNGGTYYDAEWSSYHAGNFTIVASDNEGNTVQKTISVPGNGRKETEETPVIAVPVTPPETVPVIETAPPIEVKVPERPKETLPKETKPQAEEESKASVIPAEAETEAETRVREEERLIPEETVLEMEDEDASEEELGRLAVDESAAEEPKASVVPDTSGLLAVQRICEFAEAKGAGVHVTVPKASGIDRIVTSAKRYSEGLSLPEIKVTFREELTALLGLHMNKLLDGYKEKEERPGAHDYVTALLPESIPDRTLTYTGVLTLTLLSLYELLVILLNRKRLRLYKAYVMALSRKRGKSEELLVEEAIRKAEGRKKKHSPSVKYKRQRRGPKE